MEAIVRQRLTKEALQRYGNIRAADQLKARQIIAILYQIIQSGKVQMISDAQLKEMLKGMNQQRKMNIRRV